MSAEAATLHVLAPGKVNLYLEILDRRPDGYHNLRSIATPVSLCDEMWLSPQPEGIESETESETEDEEVARLAADPAGNLAVRAARHLQQATGCRKGAHIRLLKRLPIGGGMGGGSADAAAALKALNRMWDLRLDRADLLRLGAELGSDVPALLHGGPVAMAGRGESVIPLPRRPDAPVWHVVLANPRIPVSTRDIYQRYQPLLTPDPENHTKCGLAVQAGDLELAARSLFNGLQPTVVRKYPLIGLFVEELKKAGAPGALVSGSGATVFGLARDAGQAHKLETALRGAFGAAAWTRVVRTLPDGVMAAHGPLEA